MTETDAFVLLEGKGNSFGPVFADYGHRCQQIEPRALGSPFCPPFRLLIVPSAFTAPQFYTQIVPALERYADRIRRFVEQGGIILVYGPFYRPMADTYDYPWLPARFTYRYLPRKLGVKVADPESPAAGFVKPGTVGCDGYFTRYEGEVVLTDEEGRAVLVTRQLGEGYIVMSGTFHFPEKGFVDWACAPGRMPVQM
jgi:hypothetical protein